MQTGPRARGIGLVLALGAWLLIGTEPAVAASAAEIDADVTVALDHLYRTHPEARTLGASAKGILVFPSVVKVGFLGAAQYGEGALRKRGRTDGYYSTAAASYGLQAGAQKFAYAMFFMTDSALQYLAASQGWEIGSGPSIVIVDTGQAKTLTSTTLKDDVYAFIFDQKWLMGGLGLQGSKITKIDK